MARTVCYSRCKAIASRPRTNNPNTTTHEYGPAHSPAQTVCRTRWKKMTGHHYQRAQGAAPGKHMDLSSLSRSFNSNEELAILELKSIPENPIHAAFPTSAMKEELLNVRCGLYQLISFHSLWGYKLPPPHPGIDEAVIFAKIFVIMRSVVFARLPK